MENINNHKFTFSYHSYYDDNGTHYSQTITAYIPRNIFLNLNYLLACKRLNEHNSNDYAHIYLYDTFKLKTKNFTNLTQRDFFINYFNLNNNKKFKKDRNTIIVFIPID